jgi:hypothetical protein
MWEGVGLDTHNSSPTTTLHHIHTHTRTHIYIYIYIRTHRPYVLQIPNRYVKSTSSPSKSHYNQTQDFGGRGARIRAGVWIYTLILFLLTPTIQPTTKHTPFRWHHPTIIKHFVVNIQGQGQPLTIPTLCYSPSIKLLQYWQSANEHSSMQIIYSWIKNYYAVE